MLRDLVSGLLDLVYPACCILCKNTLGALEKTQRLCFACQNKLEKNRPPFCRRCSRPLENPAHHFCLNCQNTDLEFDRGWGVFLYNDTMQRLLHLFKYGSKTGLRHFLGDQILSFINDYRIDLSTLDLIIPVPLHSARRRERGYNQSLLIARIISEDLGIPLDDKSLVRVIHTPNQARLTQKERWTNVEGAFKINNSNKLQFKNILLVDDLYTTGATASQAARILKAAGCHQVFFLATSIATLEQTKFSKNP